MDKNKMSSRHIEGIIIVNLVFQHMNELSKLWTE